MTESNPSATRTAVEAIAVVAFYLYFGGWVYANAMFGEFGISFGLVETPVYYFVVYSFSVFFATSAGWILILLIGGAWYALARYRFVRWAEILFILGLATLPFPFVRLLADARAHHDAASLRIEGKSVRFIMRNAQATLCYPSWLIQLGASGQMKLILQTKERYFAVAQANGIKGKNGRTAYPPADVYDFPTSDFMAIVKTRSTAR